MTLRKIIPAQRVNMDVYNAEKPVVTSISFQYICMKCNKTSRLDTLVSHRGKVLSGTKWLTCPDKASIFASSLTKDNQQESSLL